MANTTLSKVGKTAAKYRKDGYSNEDAMTKAWDDVKGKKGKAKQSKKSTTSAKKGTSKPRSTKKVSVLKKIFG